MTAKQQLTEAEFWERLISDIMTREKLRTFSNAELADLLMEHAPMFGPLGALMDEVCTRLKPGWEIDGAVTKEDEA